MGRDSKLTKEVNPMKTSDRLSAGLIMSLPVPIENAEERTDMMKRERTWTTTKGIFFPKEEPNLTVERREAGTISTLVTLMIIFTVLIWFW
jgi:hypothetical protein